MTADNALIDGQRGYSYAFAGLGWTRGPWTAVLEQHQTQSYLRNIVFTLTYGF